MEVGVEIYANGDLRKQEVAAQTSEVSCPYFPAPGTRALVVAA